MTVYGQSPEKVSLYVKKGEESTSFPRFEENHTYTNFLCVFILDVCSLQLTCNKDTCKL